MPQKETSLGNALDKRFKQTSHASRGQNIEDVILNKFGAPVQKIAESSVTEQSDVAEFLSRAELLGAKFESEGGPGSLRLLPNNQSANSIGSAGVLSKAMRDQRQLEVDEERSTLTIPRRPKWNKSMSPNELDLAEKQEFMRWRQSLAALESRSGCVLTPYEKNLDFWRQLWRVIERSDAVVQILDARDPLFYFSNDLCQYVEQANKQHAIILNKCDLLLPHQLMIWHKYFQSINIQVLFFAAAAVDGDADADDGDGDNDDNDDGYDRREKSESSQNNNVLSPNQLAKALSQLPRQQQQQQQQQTVGLVGYPNVGKSSTINALLKCKKVPVSAQPGRTKHLQTIQLSEQLILCDCPGLVMPQSVCTKADLIINGVLPIDTMRDCIAPVQLLCNTIPAILLMNKYSLRLDSEQKFTDATQLLSAYASLHGYMTSGGQPHLDRAARDILKDFVAGRGLVYCHPPPNYDSELFNTQLSLKNDNDDDDDDKDDDNDDAAVGNERKQMKQQQKQSLSEFDKKFFCEKIPDVGFRSRNPLSNAQSSSSSSKSSKRHNNHKKREKLRRIHQHHDAE